MSRTKIVWGALALSMTLVGGLLLLSDAAERPSALPPAAVARAEQAQGLDALLQTRVDLDDARWDGIVIHHSGAPSGSAATLAEAHRARSLRGLGYHFVIGNGRGLDDGAIQVGYRWNDQLPGAHVIGPEAEQHNRHSIGICLVGDGDRKAFTERQLASLIALVERLQGTCSIETDDVLLHADVAPTSSPGRYFPGGDAFRALLRHRD